MLRVAVVQFAPKLGKVAENLQKVQHLCSRLRPNTVDLVCLPEMALSGYVFRSPAAISPFLEYPERGPTSHFCSTLAKRLKCFVVAGYPERLATSHVVSAQTTASSLPRDPGLSSSAMPAGANSSLVYGPDGEWVAGYRKTHLYEEDMYWAEAGAGFITLDLPSPLNRVTIGICMDLNAQSSSWSLDEGPYELAQHVLDTKADTLLLLNAWLDSGANTEEDTDWQTLNYWAARLRPLWHADGSQSTSARKAVTVVVCNRSGVEEGIQFAGSSALFRMSTLVGQPILKEMYKRDEENVQIWYT